MVGYATAVTVPIRFEHLGVAATDPALLADWYAKVLGGEVLWNNGERPPALFVRLPGGPVLEIYSAATVEPLTGVNHTAGFRHLALRVDSIDLARAHLESHGVRFETAPRPAGGGGRVLFFKDPEGNLLHLVERPTTAPLAFL